MCSRITEVVQFDSKYTLVYSDPTSILYTKKDFIPSSFTMSKGLEPINLGKKEGVSNYLHKLLETL